MLISMDKKYRTKEGDNVRIVCVDVNNNYPILGLLMDSNGFEITQTYDPNGQYYSGISGVKDLVEVNEYEDFKIDEPVMMRMKNGVKWHERHFAGVDNGKPMAWANGETSWSSHTTCAWDRCRRPTKEELNS